MRHLILFISFLFLLPLTLYAENPPTPTSAFVLSSTGFENKANLPIVYTCDGKNISPALSWIGAPNNTQTFALIFSDINAPNGIFYHWIVYNIPNSVFNLSEDIQGLPPGAMAGKNTWDNAKYNGPCPPKGSVHQYILTLYALDTTLNLHPNAHADEVINAMQSHILDKAELFVKYSH